MNQREPIEVVRGACWRAAMATLLAGFLMVPSLIALRLAGLDGGVTLLAVGAVLAGWFTWLRFRQSGVSLATYLTTAGSAGSHAPPALFLAGCAFLAGGIAIVVTAADQALPVPGQMSAVEQIWFGGAFALMGLGLSGVASSHALGRLGLARSICRLTEQLQFRPDDAELHFRRGLALAQLGKLGPAVDDFSAVVRLDPQNVEVRLERGDLRYRLGDPEQAAADYTAAIELDPRNVEAYAKRAWIHRDLGREEEAEADFAMAKEIADSGESHLGDPSRG